jgi:hypothetical protein
MQKQPRTTWLLAAARINLLTRRAIRLVGAFLVDRRVRFWLDGTAAAGETVAFLPVALLAVMLSHELIGPALTLVVLGASYLLASRRSVRAIAWMSGGLYVAWTFVDAAAGLASRPPDALAEPAQGILAFSLAAGGLGAFALTFLLPLARAAKRWFPDLTRAATIWVVELAKGCLAGASIGGMLAGVIPTVGPLETPDAAGRLLIIGAATTVGVVVGGLRADGRVRAELAAVKVRA